MFFGNFAESQSKVFNEAIDEEEYTEVYGYPSDSDLEDNEDDEASSFNPTFKSKVQRGQDCLRGPRGVRRKGEGGQDPGHGVCDVSGI